MSDLSDLGLSPFKGDEVDTSFHCRKLNSLLQMEQPLWKRLEDISCYRKQQEEIKAFMKQEQKNSPMFDLAGHETEDSNSEDHRKDYVQNSSDDLWASKCSIRPRPGKVSLTTSYYPMTKTDAFMDGLAEQLRTIERQKKVLHDKVYNMLEESKQSTLSGNEEPRRESASPPPQGAAAFPATESPYARRLSASAAASVSHDSCAAAEPSLSDHLPFPPGPVGESPLHTCFLLGLRRLGIDIINKFYDTPELVSVSYLNDLDPWRKLADGGSKSLCSTTREDGLYTGETALHIAIVQEDAMLVKYLLNLGIEISSRAIGVFFQPKLLKPLSVELNRWQKLKAWLLGVDLKSNKFAAVSSIQNRESGTYYGEYPLSFAASVGNVEICNILYYCKKHRIESYNNESCKMTTRERESCRPQIARMLKDLRGKSIAKLNQHIPSLKVNHDSYSQETITNATETMMWNFLNAADKFGNTALHMAVWHQRKDVIDWLISKPGGEDSLTFVNHDSFTPLTLAARHGHVSIFHHILYKHMGRIAWVYGKVRMIQTDLLQVDTYRIRNNNMDYNLHQSQGWQCALEIIVEHEVLSFAGDELINRLINEKWSRFGRWMYITRTVVPYMLVLILLSLVAYLRGSEIQREWSKIVHSQSANSSSTPIFCVSDLTSNYSPPYFANDTGHDSPYVHYLTDDHVFTLVLEYVLVVIGSPFLVWKGWRLRSRMHSRSFDNHSQHGTTDADAVMKAYWPKNMQFFLDVLSSCFILAAGICRASCNDTSELQFLSTACIFLYCNLLYVLMPFKAIGSLVITMNTIIMHVFLRFLSTYLTILCGFSWGLYLMFQRSDGFADCEDDEGSCGWAAEGGSKVDDAKVGLGLARRQRRRHSGRVHKDPERKLDPLHLHRVGGPVHRPAAEPPHRYDVQDVRHARGGHAPHLALPLRLPRPSIREAVLQIDAQKVPFRHFHQENGDKQLQGGEPAPEDQGDAEPLRERAPGLGDRPAA
eukprot:CAMPEP_0172206554 /NCGR_PEP_ID=MMETSP1050-20130122/33289_1 /TAXON_ID=233186 /ORGANISM="Cryptomonas curvata, Strain CCAP979/52" /LENGTH=992 /DNA_ID=CAMNT_0012885663 /DNA_START=339 /DNA_END=3313 /DNA_ORIENTATION=-